MLLARNVNGCKDTIEGLNAKVALVKSFLESEGPEKQSLLNIVSWLHLLEEHGEPNSCPGAAVKIDSEALLDVIEWQRPPPGGDPPTTLDASSPGFLVASALEPCAPEDMKAVVAMYVSTNPQVNVVDMLRYVSYRGFIKDTNMLIAPNVTDWRKPVAPGKEKPNWTKVWGDGLPEGGPTFVNVRDHRGRRAKLAFLGTVDDHSNPTLKTPAEVLLGKVWREKPPSMCIHCDAGSMHPRQTDSEMMMCNLPAFYEWVGGAMTPGAEDATAASAGGSRGNSPPSRRSSRPSTPPLQGATTIQPSEGNRQPSPRQSASLSAASSSSKDASSKEVSFVEAEAAGATVRAPAELMPSTQDPSPSAQRHRSERRGTLSGKEAWTILRASVKQKSTKYVGLQDVVKKGLDEWRTELKRINTDATLGDGSINNLIYMKLKEVFSALLDAVKLADAWVIVDRTNGQGSATAEVLLELALDRGSQRPTIVAIDSLERLGKARERCERDGKPGPTRSHKMIRQLAEIYHDDENAKKEPIGTEKDVLINWMYSLDEFDKAATFADTSDAKLPFPVLPEHRRKSHRNTCDPNLKWRYFYSDGLFANASHYIIKCNDADEFNIEALARTGFLYAHGDTRTFKRLRANIQQGKPIVMLHNSGGVVTAFSWLQRVMAFSRPAPQPDKLRTPLKFLIANLSRANWVNDFGVPEVIMMKVLAERAPQLFRKHVVSVDILTDSEERTLEVIHGCFATSGGVPELGLGNAEVNVVFTAWGLHLTLCENARSLYSKSIIAQFLTQGLSLLTAVIAITASSIGTGYNERGLVLQRIITIEQERALMATGVARYAVIVLPILVGLISLVATRRQWRDKWSVCTTAASQLTFEIYKFRMSALEYDLSREDDEDGMSAKERSRLARKMFVERVQAFYTACLTELSQGSAVKRRRPKVSVEKRQEYRADQENMPTLAQWLKIKTHVERHYYQAAWAFPPKDFVTWNSGLRPYVQQRALGEELKAVVEGLVSAKKLKLLAGKPLSQKQCTLIRNGLAKKLGLAKGMLEAQTDEIRQLLKEVVAEVLKEEAEEEKEVGASAKGSHGAGGTKAREEKSRSKESGRKVEVQRPTASARATGTSARIAPQATSTVATQPATDAAAPTGEADTMRKLIMEFQGQQYGAPAAKQRKDETRKQSEQNVVEDDYLAGPLGVESYVIFRVRPLIEHYERVSVKLSQRLQNLEILGLIVNVFGAVLATHFMDFQEWVSLTVAVVMMVTAALEFTQLKSQVVAINLSLGELQNLMVWWDSLPNVRRNDVAIKNRIVVMTERAILQVIDAATTAASNTQKSVEKNLANGSANREAEEG